MELFCVDSRESGLNHRQDRAGTLPFPRLERYRFRRTGRVVPVSDPMPQGRVMVPCAVVLRDGQPRRMPHSWHQRSPCRASGASVRPVQVPVRPQGVVSGTSVR